MNVMAQKVYPDTTSKPTAMARLAAESSMDASMLDWQVAAALSTVTPSDKEFVSKKNAARDRIMKLSCELWDARQELDALKAGKADPLPDLLHAIRGAIAHMEKIGPAGDLVSLEEFYEVSRNARKQLRIAVENATKELG